MKEVTSQQELEHLIANSELPVLVDFYAVWCGPCKQMMPTLEQFEKDHGDSVIIAKVECSQSPFVRNYGVKGVPTLQLYVGGKKIDESTGVMTSGQLDKWYDWDNKSK